MEIFLKIDNVGTSLAFQWLRLYAPSAGSQGQGLVSIPIQGTNIPYDRQPKKLMNKIKNLKMKMCICSHLEISPIGTCFSKILPYTLEEIVQYLLQLCKRKRERKMLLSLRR